MPDRIKDNLEKMIAEFEYDQGKYIGIPVQLPTYVAGQDQKVVLSRLWCEDSIAFGLFSMATDQLDRTNDKLYDFYIKGIERIKYYDLNNKMDPDSLTNMIDEHVAYKTKSDELIYAGFIASVDEKNIAFSRGIKSEKHIDPLPYKLSEVEVFDLRPYEFAEAEAPVTS